MTPIPAEIVPRILALKPWLRELYPSGALLERDPITFYERCLSDYTYDLLCMALVRALQREGYEVSITPTHAVWVYVDFLFGTDDLLTNLTAAAEWAKNRSWK